jgi:hypothetical protein
MLASLIVCYGTGYRIYCLLDIFVRIHTARREPQRPAVSLFACMMLTRIVSGRMAAATSAALTMRHWSTGSQVMSKPRSPQPAADLRHRGMLDPGDDVVAAWARRQRRALQGVVVRFAAAAGEYDFFSRAAEQLRHARASLGHGFARSCAISRALYQWPLEGLPKCSPRYGRIASIASGSSGVVAL